MNTDLDEVAQDPRVGSVDFFRRMPKTRVDSRIGPTLTPNFYYRISTARLTMLAPTRAHRPRTCPSPPSDGVEEAFARREGRRRCGRRLLPRGRAAVRVRIRPSMKEDQP